MAILVGDSGINRGWLIYDHRVLKGDAHTNSVHILQDAPVRVSVIENEIAPILHCVLESSTKRDTINGITLKPVQITGTQEKHLIEPVFDAHIYTFGRSGGVH